MNDKCDKDYFEQKLTPLIMDEIGRLTLRDGVECYDRKNSCDRIWDEYVRLNARASVLYMKSRHELLDRHKVAACYMYACLKARPLEVSQDLPSDDRRWLSNEALSLSIACAVLCGYLDAILAEMERHIGEYPGLTPDSIEIAKLRLKAGVRFDDFVVGYETYEDDVLKLLFFTAAEGNYNILALSLIIYHWEQSLFKEEMRKHIARFARHQKKLDSKTQ